MSAPQPTGVMNLKINGVSSDNANIEGVNFTFTETGPSSGPVALQPHYNGDGNYPAQDAATQDIPVALPTPIINFTVSPNPIIPGQPYTVSGTIVAGS